MLSYLNGIGASRRKSGGGGGGSKGRQAIKRITAKLPPAKAAQVVKKLMAQHTPLNQIRVKKAVHHKIKRDTFQEAGEPLMLDEQPNVYRQEFVEDTEDRDLSAGDEEVNEREFSDPDGGDSESGGADIGMYYPGVGGYFKEKRKVKIEKKKSKVDIKKAKASAKTAKGTARQTRAEAKGTRAARERSGKGAELLQKGLDTAQQYLTKGQAAKDAVESTDAPAPKESFLSQYGMPLGIAAATGLGLYLVTKKKK